MTTNLLDHVQAVRSAYEAANSRGSFVGRRRITPPVPLGRRGSEWQALFGYSALIWLIWLTCACFLKQTVSRRCYIRHGRYE